MFEIKGFLIMQIHFLGFLGEEEISGNSFLPGTSRRLRGRQRASPKSSGFGLLLTENNVYAK